MEVVWMTEPRVFRGVWCNLFSSCYFAEWILPLKGWTDYCSWWKMNVLSFCTQPHRLFRVLWRFVSWWRTNYFRLSTPFAARWLTPRVRFELEAQTPPRPLPFWVKWLRSDNHFGAATGLWLFSWNRKFQLWYFFSHWCWVLSPIGILLFTFYKLSGSPCYCPCCPFPISKLGWSWKWLIGW